MNRTDRLLGILLEFQARGELRAEDLARRFEVSVRTIYRDVEALCETGVPVVALPGKGYRLAEGYFLPPLSFTASEAAVLALGAEFLRTRVDSELQGTVATALDKLIGVLPADRREAVEHWRRELLFPGTGPDDEAGRMARLRAAVRERRVVRLLYQPLRSAESGLRDVEPVSLVFLAEAWYLAAYCRLRRAPRLFRLNRIDRLEPLGERFTLEARHAMGPAQRAERARAPEARVRYNASVLRWVRERRHYLCLREESDAAGPVFVYALRDEEELLPWLLSWGSAAEVLSPPTLRQRLVREARAMLLRNAPTGDTADFTETSNTVAVVASTVSGSPA